MADETVRRGGTAELLGRSTSDGNGRTAETLSRERNGNVEHADSGTPLLDQRQLQEFRQRWEESQREFVDEPRRSVETADELVADLVRELAEEFASERSQLESQWDRGEDVSTDDLRVAFQRYRSFFNRLLEV